MANVTTRNNGIINPYTINPKNLTQYTAYRGVTDFTQIQQFDQYETGYGFLSVIQMPRFINKLAENNAPIKRLKNGVKHTMQYEFKGLTGLPDIQAETGEISDGINTINVINKVTSESAITVSMTFNEKSGSPMTKFAEYYLTGIKDRQSQAKHYHGLIKNNLMKPSYRNEVFTFMYYVTDNTYLRLEKAYLLCNAQLTKAETSMYDYTKGDIGFKEITYEFNCFPVWGYEVDKAAKTLLESITFVHTESTDNTSVEGSLNYTNNQGANTPHAKLDTNDYLYAIMDSKKKGSIKSLTEAIAADGKGNFTNNGNEWEDDASDSVDSYED